MTSGAMGGTYVTASTSVVGADDDAASRLRDACGIVGALGSILAKRAVQALKARAEED